MNKLTRIASHVLILFALCVFTAATLSSCAGGGNEENQDQENTETQAETVEDEHPQEENHEHPEEEEGEHPQGDTSEHPEGEEHPNE